MVIVRFKNVIIFHGMAMMGYSLIAQETKIVKVSYFHYSVGIKYYSDILSE